MRRVAEESRTAGTPPGASPLDPLAGAVVLALVLGGVWTWWACKSGAYFGTVFYPGAIVLSALLILLLLTVPLGLRPARASAVALGALTALGIWTLLSILWTPTRAAALADATQALTYAAAFVLGMLLCRLLARRMVLAVLPLALAGALAGLVTVITLWSGDDVARYLHSDASLRFPLGYRNANAAFFLVTLWPALVLAADPQVDRRLRPAMLATTTVLLELAILSQSRGSLPSVLIGGLAFVLLCPWRLRATAYLVLAALPALVALPALLDLYQHGEPIARAVPLLRDAARTVTLSALSALVLGVVAVRAERGIRIDPELTHRAGRYLAIGTILVAAVGSAVYLGQRGGPIGFVDQRIEEFTSPQGTPDFHDQGARFGANVGTNRDDFWRVALHAAAEQPVAGGGAGSFELTYLRERRSHETPSDPHSLEMLMLSELGVLGLALLALFAAGAAVALLRSASLGPGAGAVAACAAGAGAYWLTHASFDWFWNYPGLTAPVIFLVGAGCAPAAIDPSAVLRPVARRAAVAAALALALLSLPLFLSDRYTESALGGWRDDPARAYEDLSTARSLNPVSLRPLLAEAEIARVRGERRRALAALREAVRREPENWAPHYLIGRLLIESDPGVATPELEQALRLNPRSSEIRGVRERGSSSR
jgi:tetratricopeptide (TPR) repeat protein